MLTKNEAQRMLNWAKIINVSTPQSPPYFVSLGSFKWLVLKVTSLNEEIKKLKQENKRLSATIAKEADNGKTESDFDGTGSSARSNAEVEV